MMSESISVIVPVYNCENYLSRCLDSLINQSYTNCEIILINDGSTDSSLDICREYAARHNNIIVIDKNNGGVSSARNAGIEKSSGRYIAFVDSDDYLSPDYLISLFTSLKYKSVDVSCINHVDIVNDKEVCIYPDWMIDNKKDIVTLEDYYNDYFRGLFYTRVVWGKLFKREIIGNIRFDDELNYGEDTLFMSKIANAGAKFTLLDECKYYYFHNNKSAMGSLDDYKEKAILYRQYIHMTCKIVSSLYNVSSDIFHKGNAQLEYQIYVCLSYLIKARNYKTYKEYTDFIKKSIICSFRLGRNRRKYIFLFCNYLISPLGYWILVSLFVKGKKME